MTLPRSVVAAALGVGLVAAVVVPGERLGLGVVLVGAAVAAVAALAGRRDAWSPAWTALALALASVAVLRDATWVVVPCLALAIGTGSLAVAGGRTWRAVAHGLVAAPARAPLGLPAIGRAAAAALPQGPGAQAAPVLRGVALATLLVAVFGGLFVSSDAAFADLAGDVLPTTDVSSMPGRVAAFLAAAGLAGGVALARAAAPVAAAPPAARRLGRAEWGIALVALDLLFAAFVAVQFAVLFGRDEHVVETAGLTYAEYAREGFAQLLVAAALTLVVVAGALRWAAGARRLLRGLLAALCLLTGVVLVSALHRLDLYMDAFGATRLRVTATALLLVLGALLVLALVALAVDRLGWLPRACLLTVATSLLAFALWNPDLRIAQRNVERPGRLDTEYLSTLSADAVPALPRAIADPPPADGWGGWNLARARARDILR